MLLKLSMGRTKLGLFIACKGGGCGGSLKHRVLPPPLHRVHHGLIVQVDSVAHAAQDADVVRDDGC